MSDLNKPRYLELPLNYFRGPSRVHTWKGRFGWGILVFTVGGMLLHWMGDKEAHFGASPGPVASVHQAWDSTCSACHEPFRVTSSHSWVPPGMERATGQSCQTCHAGPGHHVGQRPDLNCASCHREHNGRDFSLVKLKDAHCTQCHQDIAAHCAPDNLPQFGNVSTFAKDRHPDFRSVAVDPGKLLFNHALHMTPGMAVRSDRGVGGVTFTLKNVPAEYRERYSGLQADKGDDAPVALSCQACHQMDAADFRLSPWQMSEISPAALRPRSTGANFMPIIYENQCKACHPLLVEDSVAVKEPRAVAVPHRKQPAEIERWLEDYFTAQAALHGSESPTETKSTRPLPGKKTLKRLAPELKAVVDANLASAVKALYKEPLKKNCRLCHAPEEVVESKKSDAGEEIVTRRLVIPPAQMPQLWYQHAKFDHMAHRTVDCRECHADAYSLLANGELNKSASLENTDILIPRMDNCVQCHAPAATRTVDGAKQLSGGVRFDCVLCHNYHHADHPLAGRGAEARGAAQRRFIQDVLKGPR